ncbi:MFS transporter [Acidipropionibacterium jensenii]|uniref:MFS transporter n=1 Tax=Acidipropionibacterium jensenii TaxID=1749 RepID=UPI002647C4BF|nr:MFS transporter [Acidipropionibacterium jensenii]MDN5976209.1 MFS transporter [Acidipropionibacterium jensenii]MDN5996175.1 MFS transporter [Acidipropionibacterium jensenii]MDN6021896.1 MFS transporter [Acidipropionibacterium jensenii]MDN6427067.1 MFS transporter [Acidipropionibacterium jensenii]MDN6441689.1 MFS transporter [Acidipropionibacterium jensenii]
MSAAPGEVGRTFASFSVPNYTYYFIGSLVSNLGLWMGRTAQDWMVLTQLTQHSSSALGYVTALQFLPIAVLAPTMGAVADRWPKHNLLYVSQGLLALDAAALWLLDATGVIQLWHVLALAFLQGVFSSLDNPVRQAFVPEMVPMRLVPNAIGLNSAQFNGARLLGPGLGGLLIAGVGVSACLLINALSFAAVIVSLAVMDRRRLTPAPVRRGGGAVREGIRYVRRRPDILVPMVIVFMLGTFGMNFQITNALMATKVFGKGAGEYGLLGSIMAVGTLAAALLAARRAHPRLRTLLIPLAGFAVFTAVLGVAPSYQVYALTLVPVGLCALTVMTSANATVQMASDPDVRGRVMALYMAIFLGGTPIGAPIIGWIGDAWGPRWTLLIGSAATALTVIGVLLFVTLHDGMRMAVRSGWPPKVAVVHGSGPPSGGGAG